MTFARCHGDPANEHARTQALLEARQIAVLFPSVRVRAPEALARAESVARELGDADEPTDDAIEHVERVRSLAALARAELPFDGFPRTSAAIEKAAELVSADLGYARAVASLCLEAYVHELAPRVTPLRGTDVR